MEGEEDPSLGDVLDGVAEAVITNKVNCEMCHAQSALPMMERNERN